METLENTLVIISGASRGIGKAFLNHYSQQPNTNCIGLTRSKNTNQQYAQLDLLQTNKVKEFVNHLNLTDVDKVIYMHSIGIDKFEPNGKPHIDTDNDGIDDEVYSSNVTAFKNLAEPLMDRIYSKRLPLTIINIGSLSDMFEVPFWQSFSKSKNQVRQYMKANSNEKIKGVMLNVSSTLDEEGRKYGRPFADTTYWQKAEDLVSKSVKFIDGHEPGVGYIEADFFNPSPFYRPDYFTNHARLYKIWQKDMGFEGKEIPHGIRI
ncbi:MAG: SDR family NAD(P)-dependent oxidoreductase [Candidatus Woesearchaeota archaeon]|jgi:NADP-dependent 3-hydroxy acid dehydrogenase YdfG